MKPSKKKKWCASPGPRIREKPKSARNGLGYEEQFAEERLQAKKSKCAAAKGLLWSSKLATADV
jgi:hypothetical protein